MKVIGERIVSVKQLYHFFNSHRNYLSLFQKDFVFSSNVKCTTNIIGNIVLNLEKNM